jgi:LmbE family N-acetylglucosaminyl deacetylase
LERFRNGYFPYVAGEIKDYFEGLKRELTPDLILTHYRDDAHQDHRPVRELTWNTWRDHLILEYEVPKYDGDLGTPNLFVALERNVVDRKIENLMRCFQTQRKRHWFDETTFRGLMRLRGVEACAPEGFAEAFHARKCWL